MNDKTRRLMDDADMLIHDLKENYNPVGRVAVVQRLIDAVVDTTQVERDLWKYIVREQREEYHDGHTHAKIIDLWLSECGLDGA